MCKITFPLQEGERVLGRWPMHYLPPWGGRYAGELEVTDRRVLFAAPLAPGSPMVGIGNPPPNARTAADVLDLDAHQVVCEPDRLLISIAKSEIESVRPDRPFLRSCVGLTIRNNGSTHLFENGLRSVAPVLRAIEGWVGRDR